MLCQFADLEAETTSLFHANEQDQTLRHGCFFGTGRVNLNDLMAPLPRFVPRVDEIGWGGCGGWVALDVPKTEI